MTTHDEQTSTPSNAQMEPAMAPSAPSVGAGDPSSQTTSESARPSSENTRPSSENARTESSPTQGGLSDVRNESSASRTEPSDMESPASSTPNEASTDKALFADDDLSRLRSRWGDVQAAFVDDPKDCVQKADVLVAEVVEQLTTRFSEARSRLEAQWARGEEASTEDLRVALKRYREFFQRLLAI